MSLPSHDIISLLDGDISLWIEQGTSIHLKTLSPYGDPLELSAEEAKELAKHLLLLASTLDNE
jgi:hypothetical protein